MRAGLVEWDDMRRLDFLPRPYLVNSVLSSAWKLGELCELASGQYVPEYCHPTADGAKPYLRVDNVRQFLPNLSNSDLVYVRLDHVPNSDRVSVRSGDVVVARTGTLGRAFVVEESTHGAIMSQHVTRLRLRPQYRREVDPFVLAAYLNSQEGYARVHALASGSTRLELTHEGLGNVQVPHTLKEVNHLAPQLKKIPLLFRKMLACASTAIERCDDLIRRPGPLTGDSLQWFLANGDPKSLCSFLPRYHLPSLLRAEQDLRSRYVCKTLGELAEVTRGVGTTSREYTKRGVPYLLTSSLVNFGVELFPEHYAEEDVYRMHGQNIGEGDLLLTIEGKIGEVALLGRDERCVIKNHIEVIRMRPEAEVPREFLYAVLASRIGQQQLHRRTIVQTTIPGLASASREVFIPVAPRRRSDRHSFQGLVHAVRDNVAASVEARVVLRSSLEVLMQAVDESVRVAVHERSRGRVFA